MLAAFSAVFWHGSRKKVTPHNNATRPIVTACLLLRVQKRVYSNKMSTKTQKCKNGMHARGRSFGRKGRGRRNERFYLLDPSLREASQPHTLLGESCAPGIEEFTCPRQPTPPASSTSFMHCFPSSSFLQTLLCLPTKQSSSLARLGSSHQHYSREKSLSFSQDGQTQRSLSFIYIEVWHAAFSSIGGFPEAMPHRSCREFTATVCFHAEAVFLALHGPSSCLLGGVQGQACKACKAGWSLPPFCIQAYSTCVCVLLPKTMQKEENV